MEGDNQRRELKDEELSQLIRVANRVAGVWSKTAWVRFIAEPREDLEQVAFIGAFKAHLSHEGERGCSYTQWLWIGANGEVRHYLRNQTLVTIPRRIYEARPKVKKANSTLRQRCLDRPPTQEEVAAECGLPVPVVQEVQALEGSFNITSLDQPIDHDLFLSECIPAAEDGVEDTAIVREALAHLPDRERAVTVLRYCYGFKQWEVARLLGITRAKVSLCTRDGAEQLRQLVG